MQPSTTAAIEVREVRMSYPSLRPWLPFKRRGSSVDALSGVNLELPRQARVALFGENGTGKTTLLKLIAGLLIPTSGTITVGPSEKPTSARLSVGYVIGDERSFYWRLSAVENLRFFAALDHCFGASADRRIASVLERVGLSRSSSRVVGEYSAGMRQRLAIARGLLSDPEVLLIDEPTRSLDPSATDAVLATLRESLEPRRTLLLATNRFEDAVALCQTVAVLRDGRIVVQKDFGQSLSERSLSGFVREHLTAATPPA